MLRKTLAQSYVVNIEHHNYKEEQHCNCTDVYYQYHHSDEFSSKENEKHCRVNEGEN